MPSNREYSFKFRMINQETLAEKRAYQILDSMNLRVEKQKIWRTKKSGERKSYFIDLYLPDYLLGIEIDGGIHKDRVDYDIERDLAIMGYGSRMVMLRFTNEDVLYRQEYFKKVVSETLCKRMHYLNCVEWGKNHLDDADRYIELKSWSGQFRHVMMLLESPKVQNVFYKDKYIFAPDVENDTWIGYELVKAKENQSATIAS